MAEIDRRNPGEAEYRGHGLKMVMSVDQIRRRGERVQAVDDGHGGAAQLVSHVAQHSAISNRFKATPKQCDRNIAHVKLRARASR